MVKLLLGVMSPGSGAQLVSWQRSSQQIPSIWDEVSLKRTSPIGLKISYLDVLRCLASFVFISRFCSKSVSLALPPLGSAAFRLHSSLQSSC